MKRRTWPYWIGGVAVVVGYGYYRYCVPKIGHATAAQIDAVLPAVLKEEDAPDPSGETRFKRVLQIADRIDASDPASAQSEKALEGLEKLLEEGPLRTPYRAPNSPMNALEIKDLAKLIATAASRAGKAGDAKACARWTVLSLRYASALRDSQGTVIDALRVIAMEAIARQTAYLAEIKGWLDDAGSARVLAYMPATDGRSAAWAGSVRRDFQRDFRRLLLDPKANEQEIMGSFVFVDPELPDQPKLSFFGNIDPVETARLAGKIYAAFIADMDRPSYLVREDEREVYAEIEKGMPREPESDGEKEPSGWAQFRFHMAMNAHPNSLGIALAGQALTGAQRDVVARDAAQQNLIRAVYQLRMGRPVDAIDPFDGQPLRVDRQRKVVWSVGTNRKDDGGAIGRGGDNLSDDLGYPYGDDSYRPNPNGPFRPEPSDMPPNP